MNVSAFPGAQFGRRQLVELSEAASQRLANRQPAPELIAVYGWQDADQSHARFTGHLGTFADQSLGEMDAHVQVRIADYEQRIATLKEQRPQRLKLGMAGAALAITASLAFNGPTGWVLAGFGVGAALWGAASLAQELGLKDQRNQAAQFSQTLRNWGRVLESMPNPERDVRKLLENPKASMREEEERVFLGGVWIPKRDPEAV